MNKELLRQKLIELYCKDIIRITNQSPWGFFSNGLPTYELIKSLNVSEMEFLSVSFDSVGKEVALEISNFPLNKALS